MWTDSEPQDAQPYQFKAKRTTWYDNLEKQEQPEQYSEFVDDEQDDAPEKMPRSKRTWIILGSLGGLLVLLIAATAGTYAHYQGLASKNNLLAAQNSLAASSSTSSSASVPTPTYQPAKEALQTVAASIVLDTTPQTTSSSEAPPPTSTSTTASSSSSTSSTSLSQPTSSKPAAFVTVQVKSTTSTPPVPKSTPSPSPPPATSTVVPIAAPSSSPPSQPATPPSGSSYMLQTYNGVATHFPGSQLPTSALACGDAYTQPGSTYFAALCKSTFDSFPGTTPTSITNSNKSPACGAYVAGRKDLTGAWLVQGDGKNWATVGGDGQLSCVGTEGVRCHVPRTITITHGSTTVSNVMIVDRNQGIGASPCSPGDVDVSDAVYRILAKTTTADANAGLGIEVQGVSWRWD